MRFMRGTVVAWRLTLGAPQAGDAGTTSVALAFEVPGGWRDVKTATATVVLQTLLGGGESFSAGGPGKARARAQPPARADRQSNCHVARLHGATRLARRGWLRVADCAATPGHCLHWLWASGVLTLLLQRRTGPCITGAYHT
jgi:hypothetical protein